MPRELQPCGTPGAYQRHLRRYEEACRPCKDAIAALRREQKKANPKGPRIHWQAPGQPERTAICNGRRTRAEVTTRPQFVTCDVCKQARSWKEAA